MHEDKKVSDGKMNEETEKEAKKEVDGANADEAPSTVRAQGDVCVGRRVVSERKECGVCITSSLSPH